MQQHGWRLRSVIMRGLRQLISGPAGPEGSRTCPARYSCMRAGSKILKVGGLAGSPVPVPSVRFRPSGRRYYVMFNVIQVAPVGARARLMGPSDSQALGAACADINSQPRKPPGPGTTRESRKYCARRRARVGARARPRAKHTQTRTRSPHLREGLGRGTARILYRESVQKKDSA